MAGGWQVNAKRIYRLYTDEGLSIWFTAYRRHIDVTKFPVRSLSAHLQLRVDVSHATFSPKMLHLELVLKTIFTSGKPHGTGLGMAICKNIIEGHHGDIHLTSEVGTGTTVNIWLPLSQDSQLVKG